MKLEPLFSSTDLGLRKISGQTFNHTHHSESVARHQSLPTNLKVKNDVLPSAHSLHRMQPPEHLSVCVLVGCPSPEHLSCACWCFPLPEHLPCVCWYWTDRQHGCRTQHGILLRTRSAWDNQLGWASINLQAFMQISPLVHCHSSV